MSIFVHNVEKMFCQPYRIPTVFFETVSDVTCVISWVVAFSAGRHSKLASPFTNDVAGVILNNFIIMGGHIIVATLGLI